jgi:hypothetical protein
MEVMRVGVCTGSGVWDTAEEVGEQAVREKMQPQ